MVKENEIPSTSNTENTHGMPSPAEPSPPIATLYRALISVGATETQLIWQRYSAFLIVNGFYVTALTKEEGYASLLLGFVGLFTNAVWHILNYAGWSNQNTWHYFTANLHPSLSVFKLPTDAFKKKRRPSGWIYWIAQSIPTGFSVGAMMYINSLLNNRCSTQLTVIVFSFGLWLFMCALVLIIEYLVIDKSHTKKLLPT